jgi:hypothetical protein
LVPGVTGLGVTTFVTARSALVVPLLTVVLDVAELLPGVGSVVAALTLAVSLMVLPTVAFEGTLAMTLIVAVAPAARVPILSLTALPLLLSVNAGPELSDCETNVTPLGSVSASATVWASLGPLFVTVRV